MPQTYLDVTQEAGRRFFTKGITGPIVMLNLLRFRETADYSASPDLTPAEPVSGAEAFQLYIDGTMPFLKEAGGELIFIGDGGELLIGPEAARWDLVMLVRHRSPNAFLAFASNDAYKVVLGHRTAALEDSRLLPIVERRED